MVSLRWGGAMGWNPGRQRPNSSYTAICWCRAGPGLRLICSGILWAWYVSTSVLQYLQTGLYTFSHLYTHITPPALLSGRRPKLVLLRQLLVYLLTNLLHYRLLNERTSQLCVVVSNLHGDWNVTIPDNAIDKGMLT